MEDENMPDQDYSETIQSYDQLGQKYLDDTIPLAPPEKVEFIKLLPPGGKILDIGCAGGRDSKTFAERGFIVVGIDLSDVFLEKARQDVPSAEFLHMDAKKIAFPNNTLDAIWANAVLLHIKKYEIPSTLQKWYRALKPSGKMHIRVKQGAGSSFVEDDVLAPGYKRLMVFFSEDEVIQFLEQAGFDIISSEIIADEAKRKGVNWIRVWAKKPQQ